MKQIKKNIQDESGMLELARQLAKIIQPGSCVYMHGLLGAGKTTFVRGFLNGLGYEGKVKSPTFALVESYAFGDLDVHHFDLYRINDPEELLYIGIKEYFHPQSICFVEWPENGADCLPAADLTVNIDFAEKGRAVNIMANSKLGEAYLMALSME